MASFATAPHKGANDHTTLRLSRNIFISPELLPADLTRASSLQNLQQYFTAIGPMAAVHPAVARPPAVQPAVARPPAVKPAVARPTVAAVQPAVARPPVAAVQPAVARPPVAAVQPAVARPPPAVARPPVAAVQPAVARPPVAAVQPAVALGSRRYGDTLPFDLKYDRDSVVFQIEGYARALETLPTKARSCP